MRERKRREEQVERDREADARQRQREREDDRIREADDRREKQRREDQQRDLDRRDRDVAAAEKQRRFDEQMDREDRERAHRTAHEAQAAKERRERDEADRVDRDARAAKTFYENEKKRFTSGLSKLLTADDKNTKGSNAIDLYWNLGLDWSEDPTTEHISKAVRELLLVHHPDKNPENPEKSKIRLEEYNLAKRVLMDKEGREAYDDKHIISDVAFEYWRENRMALQAYESS